jgi:peptidoglycan/xylan/chitin deacetylase (PgdA/CDA1 family)
LADIQIGSKGIFTISLDFELIWGTLDLFGPDGFANHCVAEREHVIDRLLDLFTEFDVPATWCILGHLFLDQCRSIDGVKHPEIVRPSHKWCAGDWFERDPGGTEGSQPVFFGRSLVRKIQSCPVPQEIGSHSFSHVIFGDAGCSRLTAASELTTCVRVADEMGIRLRSFAFPRNEPGHLDLLPEHGFACYRGVEPNWYYKPRWPSAVRRLAHLSDVIVAARPPVVVPEVDNTGLVNIPGSMIYFPRHGFRRYIPNSLRVKRAAKGLRAAADQKRIFHLWFHPTNLAGDQQTMDAMFGGLSRILEYAQSLRRRGEIEVLSMGQIADASVPKSAAPGAINATAPGRSISCAG